MKETTSLVSFSDGENDLYGSWSYPEGFDNGPLVIFATGDGPGGSKGQTWTNFVPMFNARGIATFQFDFTGLGHSPGVYQELTLSVGRKNFRAAVQFAQRTGKHNKERVGIVGASYGGNVTLLEAADFHCIRAVGLKSPSTFLPEGYVSEYGVEEVEKWGKEGYSEIIGLNYSAVLDSLKHNTYEQASKITVPIHIVHGTKDKAVPIRQVRDLMHFLKNGSINEIEGADHWYSEGDEWPRMAESIVNFMASTL